MAMLHSCRRFVYLFIYLFIYLLFCLVCCPPGTYGPECAGKRERGGEGGGELFLNILECPGGKDNPCNSHGTCKVRQ